MAVDVFGFLQGKVKRQGSDRLRPVEPVDEDLQEALQALVGISDLVFVIIVLARIKASARTLLLELWAIDEVSNSF